MDVADINVDGIQETKSNKVSDNVFSLRFKGCKNIYIIAIQRPVFVTAAEEKVELINRMENIINQVK